MQLGQSGEGIGNHYADFISAIRNNDPKNYNKGIEEGFYTCALVHLANIAYRLGRSLDFDSKTMKFANDAEANGMLKREYRKPFVVQYWMIEFTVSTLTNSKNSVVNQSVTQ